MGKVLKIIERKSVVLKQEIDTLNSIYNLIDFLINKSVKKIFLNFSYIDDDEKPSITIGGFDSSVSEDDFNQILHHPDISRRESIDNYPFINSCFNLAKKINIHGKKNDKCFSLTYENKDIPSPYLDYKLVSKVKTQQEISSGDFILIKFEILEDIYFGENNSSNYFRKPHTSFYKLLNLINKNISIRYYKFINNGYKFFVSTKASSRLIVSDFTTPIESCSPFQEQDPQCQELEEIQKNIDKIELKVKPFLISPENNNNYEEKSEMHGIYFVHENKIVYFDQWDITSIKKKRILAKDPNKIVRIRVLVDGDIKFGKVFSINPITGKLKISNELLKMIDIQIEKSLSTALSLTLNIAMEDEIELQDIAKNDALAAYKELVYSQKYKKENAIRKICDEGEMVKFNFIEDYLKGVEI